MPTASRPSELVSVAQEARRQYVARITSQRQTPWWTAVVVTASSKRQAERYENELQRRQESGQLPADASYLVVPDLEDVRIGSGGATLNVLNALARSSLSSSGAASLEEWWNGQRVLLIHSGGDSRRLPEYSLSGKLFSALPVRTPWGDVSTVFDETLVLSTAWVERLEAGLVVGSGDVVLTFSARQLDWTRPGVCGVAMREPASVGSQHGVYVLGDEGRVYSFLQKPSAAKVRAAGGMLPDETVALDVGLLRFDPATAARLTALAGAVRSGDKWKVTSGILGEPGARPEIDLYEHMTLALTGEWSAPDDASPALTALSAVLRNVPFWCSVVDGDFTHVGTTSHFRRLMTEDTSFRQLYTTRQRIGAASPAAVDSAGVIVDSVFAAGGEVGSGSVVIECNFDEPVRVGRNAILHGAERIPGPVRIPDETVVHQAPVRLADGRRGIVVRVYGLADDPKAKIAAGSGTWFGRPMMTVLEEAGLDTETVWPGVPVGERCLWNAGLFVFGSPKEAWACARWLMGEESDYTAGRWQAAERLSLADSSRWADGEALSEARASRLQAGWHQTTVALAESGSDIRPMLSRSPGVSALTKTGEALRRRGRELEDTQPAEAASRHYQAGLFLGQAGLEGDAEQARSLAFSCVRKAVDDGCGSGHTFSPQEWQHERVRVAGPARIDFGGGWSDTPPFCLDWGGTVFNMAISIDGKYPIATEVARIGQPVVRCVAGDDVVVFRDAEEILGTLGPGSNVAIPRAALRLLRIVNPGRPLARQLEVLGGGIEIRTDADLPLGSGLGTSSILGATTLRALGVMAGIEFSEATLSDQVMRLEQLMTTGGGWQDQAGGIFPGAKVVTTGPGLRQRLRVQPLQWSEERQQEFLDRFVLYCTGIRRVAKDLLAQVVGSYLAREAHTLQVLHSIKTLAVEMSYAMAEGEWRHFGGLLDRHWQLNQILDPHTTNAPIESILDAVRAHLAGAKLAGAGGGGFLMLMAEDPGRAQLLRDTLRKHPDARAGVHSYAVAREGLQVTTG